MIVSSAARVRGLAMAAATVGVVAFAVAVAPAAGAAPAEGNGSIHPGVVTESDGGGACTSNFIFTSGDRTFIGQAAHCAGTGTATETDGCNSGSGPIGTAVTIRADDGTERMGKLAYSSWLAMQEAGETDANACSFNDLALVEIAAADVKDVDPTIPFFGGPRGLDTDGLPAGEEVHSYGNSPLRQGLAALSPKTGVSAGDDGEGWTHEVYTVTPGIPGDSGSAFIDADGDAVGALSTLNLAPLPLSNGVSDLAKALEYARAHSEFTDLELELGTVPFKA
jgi:hypothetical protein